MSVFWGMGSLALEPLTMVGRFPVCEPFKTNKQKQSGVSHNLAYAPLCIIWLLASGFWTLPVTFALL
jgi:hypothetical protein